MNSNPIVWPKGCRAAVSLTYDDGIPNHPQVVAPALEARGFRGTFYAPLSSDIEENPLVWREMAKRGHELGNHTVYHPCWSINGKHSAWLDEQRNLVNYDEARWLDEITTANNALTLIDGRTERTFGNTCFDNYIGPAEAPICLEPLIAQKFSAARGENTETVVNLKAVNFNNLGTVWADRRAFEDFTKELDEILAVGGWVIYTFHGVGGGSHDHFIDAKEHLRLLDFLHQNVSQIWTAPLIEVARHLKKTQKSSR